MILKHGEPFDPHKPVACCGLSRNCLTEGRCQWRGTLDDCNPESGPLVSCPRCGAAVVEVELPKTPAQQYASMEEPFLLFGLPVKFEDGAPAKRRDFASEVMPGESN